MSGDQSRMVKDPICGKDVDTLRARAVGIFGGVTYYFCSQECKSKYVDPRQEAPATPPRDTGERRKPEKLPAGVRRQPAAPVDKQPPAPEALKPEAEGSEPVRYAHSRMRRVTGEVSTPVVQIDLSPNKKPAPAATSADEELAPARSSRGWAWIAIVMLILAGGVIFFTLKHR